MSSENCFCCSSHTDTCHKNEDRDPLDQYPFISWMDFPENQNENYCHEMVDKIKNHPRKWLASLPMFEYAYVLVTATAMRHGGKIEPYVTNLYETKMNPILKAYYDKLMHYRFRRTILMRHYASLEGKLTNTSLKQELRAMQKFTRQTRRALRGVVADFIEEMTGTRTTPKAVEDTLQECYPISDLN